MPILNLAEEIGRYLPNSGSEGTTSNSIGGVAVASAVGGILGSLLGGSQNGDKDA